MVGVNPLEGIIPPEYRLALDVARIIFTEEQNPIVLCQQPALTEEVYWRFPDRSGRKLASTALWVEPLDSDWQTDLAALTSRIKPGGLLGVISSRPLARILPERRGWEGIPLGVQVGGNGKMRRALIKAGFTPQASYGFHSLLAIGINMFSQQVERYGYPKLGDRLHFASRLNYIVGGAGEVFSTVTFLIARNNSKRKDSAANASA